MAYRNSLPRFTEHAGDAKNCPIAKPLGPPQYIRRFLDRAASDRGIESLSGARVLDVGCGRGDTVAWLLENGWDAYGVDVSSSYVAHGQTYLKGIGEDPGRLRLITEDLTYPFDDSYFDFVISDQVFEHVSNLDSLAREVARVSKSGARGLHIYPAKWRPIEVHMFTPFIHWLPKGPVRRAGLAGTLSLGLGARYFKDFPLREQGRYFFRIFRRTDILSIDNADCSYA